MFGDLNFGDISLDAILGSFGFYSFRNEAERFSALASTASAMDAGTVSNRNGVSQMQAIRRGTIKP